MMKEARSSACTSAAPTTAATCCNVENFSPEVLTVAGDLASVVIGPDHLAGLAELLALAERGRQDYQHQAQYGDYNQKDQDEATVRWVSARNAALVIRQQIPSALHH